MLDIQKDDSSDIHVLTFAGEWDLYEKERTKSYFNQVAQASPRGLVVDLTPVSLLDSSGVEVLISSFLKLRENGTMMVLVTDHNNYLIRKFRNLGIFEGTGLTFYETVEEAREAIEQA